MALFITKRLLMALATVLVVAVLAFLLVHAMPGSPGAVSLGAGASQEAIDEVNARLGWNDPLLAQFVRWLGDAVQGNLGISLIDGRSVSDDLASRLPVTASLAAGATVLSAVLQAGGGYVLAQLVGDMGKAKESELFKKNGGRPTENLLSHELCENKAAVKLRHARIRALLPDVTLPSPALEKRNPAAAMQTYEAVCDQLRNRVRKDEAIFRELCDYGFRRNFWALKVWGVLICIGALATLGYSIWHLHEAQQLIPRTYFGLVAFDVAFLAIWLFRINDAYVMRGAKLYADRFLDAVNTLPLG